jgi:hypothetical protein
MHSIEYQNNRGPYKIPRDLGQTPPSQIPKTLFMNHDHCIATTSVLVALGVLHPPIRRSRLRIIFHSHSYSSFFLLSSRGPPPAAHRSPSTIRHHPPSISVPCPCPQTLSQTRSSVLVLIIIIIVTQPISLPLLHEPREVRDHLRRFGTCSADLGGRERESVLQGRRISVWISSRVK